MRAGHATSATQQLPQGHNLTCEPNSRLHVLAGAVHLFTHRTGTMCDLECGLNRLHVLPGATQSFTHTSGLTHELECRLAMPPVLRILAALQHLPHCHALPVQLLLGNAGLAV